MSPDFKPGSCQATFGVFVLSVTLLLSVSIAGCGEEKSRTVVIPAPATGATASASTVAGNTNAPTMMIAEVAADRISSVGNLR